MLRCWFLVCATLFLAGGCGGGPGEPAPQDPGTPTSLTLNISGERPSGGKAEIEVTATLDDPAPSGGTTVDISLSLTLEGGDTVEYDATITIAAGRTTGTTTIIIEDPNVVNNVRLINVNATSTNPVLRAPPAILDPSGSSPGRPSGPPPPTRPNPIELQFSPEQLSSPNAPDGRDYRDAEFMTHYGLAAISADEAYKRGYFGQGVTIAVADDGMDITHPDLAVAGKIRAPRHIRNRNAVVREPSYAGGHGTYVALLAAGAADNTGGNFEIALDDRDPIPTENVHGVAPQASVMPIAIAGGGSPVDAVRYAAENGAEVLNLSIGVSTSLLREIRRERRRMAYRRISAAFPTDSHLGPGFAYKLTDARFCRGRQGD